MPCADCKAAEAAQREAQKWDARRSECYQMKIDKLESQLRHEREARERERRETVETLSYYPQLCAADALAEAAAEALESWYGTKAIALASALAAYEKARK